MNNISREALAKYLVSAEVTNIVNCGVNKSGQVHIMTIYKDGAYFDFYEEVEKEDE